MAQKSPSLSEETLQKVSRSFGLTLKLLPKKGRSAVTLAYALARAADTLSDSGSASSLKRLAYLKDWENAILHADSRYAPPTLEGLSESEESLRLAMPSLIRDLQSLSNAHQTAVVKVIMTLISAMVWDLERFNGDFEKALPMSENDFDWYCYHIAGCVGQFWVEVFDLSPSLVPSAIIYGKALQRINILRDLVDDQKRGRWYLPFSKSRQPWKETGWNSFLISYLAETKTGLCEGIKFCNALPRLSPLFRVASALPAFIGLKTLDQLATTTHVTSPVKISRDQLKQISLQLVTRAFLARSFPLSQP